MELTGEDIQSFIEMWEKAFGEELTPDQARAEATMLLDFFITLAEDKREQLLSQLQSRSQ